jgi:hypothetical protein
MITINGGDTYYSVPSLAGDGYALDEFHPLAYTSRFRVGNAITIWVDSDNFPTPAGGTSSDHEVVAVRFTNSGLPEFTSDYYRHPGHKTDAAWFWGRIAIGAAVSLFVLPFLGLVLVAVGRRIWRVRPR